MANTIVNIKNMRISDDEYASDYIRVSVLAESQKHLDIVLDILASHKPEIEVDSDPEVK